MKSMEVEHRIAVFLFQAHQFQKDCLPYAENVITVIDSYLPAMAIRRNEKLQETLRVRIEENRGIGESTKRFFVLKRTH